MNFTINVNTTIGKATISDDHGPIYVFSERFDPDWIPLFEEIQRLIENGYSQSMAYSKEEKVREILHEQVDKWDVSGRHFFNGDKLHITFEVTIT